MKLMSLTVPILIVSLTVIAVWGMGMLAVKTSAISTQASLDLLRLHLRVARLHEALLQHSKQALISHAAKLADDGGPPALRHLGEGAAADAETETAGAAETAETAEGTALRPWPTPETPETTETAPARGDALMDGLRKAKPALHRLAGQLDQALPPR